MGVGVRVGGRECRRGCGLFRERRGPRLPRLVGTLVARLPRGQPSASPMSRRRLVRTFVLWSIPPSANIPTQRVEERYPPMSRTR